MRYSDRGGSCTRRVSPSIAAASRWRLTKTMSGTKRKAAFPASQAPEKRAHREDEGGDLDLDEQATRQQKARPGRVVTQGYDSEESDDEDPTHKRNWTDKKPDEDDDMFGDNDAKAKDTKKEPRFLKLSEIEGQEFGSTTQLYGDEDEDEDVDPEYELERALQDTRYQDANADAERTPPGSDDEDHPRKSKKGMGFRMEKFNMKDEMASGQFDEEGNYIRNKKDPFSQNDRWLEGNYSKKQIKAAHDAQLKRERDAEARAEADEAEYPTAEHAMRALAECLQPGESVLDALQRIGAQAKRKGGDAALLEKITHLTTLLMSSFGQIHIYDEVYEGLVRQVRRAKLVPEDWDPSRPTEPERAPDAADESQAGGTWEYKWTPAYLAQVARSTNTPANPDSETFGPFPASALREWASQGYFGPQQSNILLRTPGSSTWCAWADAGL